MQDEAQLQAAAADLTEADLFLRTVVTINSKLSTMQREIVGWAHQAQLHVEQARLLLSRAEQLETEIRLKAAEVGLCKQELKIAKTELDSVLKERTS